MPGLATDVRQNTVWNADSNGSIDLRVLVLEWLSFLLVSLLAVWITVWAPQYWKLLKQTLSWLDSNYPKLYIIRIPSRVPNGKGENRRAQGDRRQSAVSDILSRSRTAEEAFIALGPQLLKSGVGIAFLAIVLCAGIFVIIAGAGTAISFLILDSNTLSTSPNCGMWIPSGVNNTANPIGAIVDAVESYYVNCYESDISVQSCGLFADDNLYINYTDSVECPFGENLCVLGKYSGISLDTGYLDSKVLGINSRHRPFFRRRNICAPVETDGFYDMEFDNTTSFTSINFYYGSRLDINANATYTQIRSPPYEQLFSPSGYEIKTLSTTLAQFEPINELQSTTGDTFLAFVNTFNLQYPEISTDPIFPATNSSPCSYSSQTCWKDSQLHASVLACTEFAEVCYPDPNTCYNAFDPTAFSNLTAVTWAGAEETLLTIFGLSYSDFGSTLSTKHGFLLDATRRIVGNRVSQALDPEQWKLEVRRLFGMAVLRAKWEMLYVVRGTRAGDAGYEDVLPEGYRGVCGKLLFQVKGYKNISFVGVLASIIVPLLLGAEYEEKAAIIWLLIGIRKVVEVSWRGITQASQVFREFGRCGMKVFTLNCNQQKSDLSPSPVRNATNDESMSKSAETDSKTPATLDLDLPSIDMSELKNGVSIEVNSIPGGNEILGK